MISQAEYGIEQSGFASAIGPNDTHDLTLVYSQRDTVDGTGLAVEHLQVSNFQ